MLNPVSARLAIIFAIFSAPYLSAGTLGADNPAAGGNDPAPAPAFAGVSLKVQNSLTPPGGMFQFQLMLTEPKPIGSGSTRPSLPAGPVTGISLNDPAGGTAGVAVINSNGIQINFDSPAATFGAGTVLDYPILTIAMPISDNAAVGTQFPIGIDLNNSFWIDPSGQPYPQELNPGRLTIGGSLSISNVVPGGGLQKAGARISILGIGFTPASQVDISGVSLAPSDYQLVSAQQIDVILPQDLQMDGARVRVKEKGAITTYFSYLRAQPIGQSMHALVGESYPLFSRQTYARASLPWTRSGSLFTALAVQNPASAAAEVTVEMHAVTGEMLGAVSFPLPPFSKMTRDLTELFPQVPAQAAVVNIQSTQPVQMLGLLGDDASGNVVPVIVSAP